jgi:hypothetical protein
LGRGESALAAAEPPVPRAPTHRGERAQRAAGIVPQILARPKPPAAPPAEVPAPSGFDAAHHLPPPPGAGEGQVWPPPPAVWEPGPSPAPPVPAERPAPAGRVVATEPSPPSWAPPGTDQSQNPRPGFSRFAAGWTRTGTRDDRPATATQTSVAAPSNYLWQSLACLFLFLPSALVAILYSTQVNRRVQIGDMTGAIRASRLARTWCLVTVAVFTLLVLWLMARGGTP